MMTNEIDQLLVEWKNHIKVVSQNLLDLQELPAYQRLSGSFGFPQVNLTGITAVKVAPAIDSVNDLFQYFDILVQVIDKANYLRQQLPRFLVTEQKIAEIKQLLAGNSIELNTVKIPLAERELLTGNQSADYISPQQLLQIMTRTFSFTRDTILAVDHAWENLDLIFANTQSQIDSLQKLATSLNPDAFKELAELRGVVVSLQIRSEQDPLGVQGEIEQQIQSKLTKVQATLGQLAQQQSLAQDKLAAAQKIFQQLAEIHKKSVATFAESQQKVVDHSINEIPLNQGQLDALSQWLTRLETKLATGLINPVIIGLANWLLKAEEYITTEQQTYTAHNNLLQTRQELRGRLDALQAKALARGMIEDVTLIELAAQAKQLLYLRPTPLNQAADLISQYEKRLNRVK